MKVRTLVAAALVAAATPALAAGWDSEHSPYPASAYPGYAGLVSEYIGPLGVDDPRPAPAYRFSGQHAGGPADALPRD
jgi:hypothetical protein